MPSEEFGLMKLLEKLIGERGKGSLSDKEMTMLKGAGSKMFIDQDEGWLSKPTATQNPMYGSNYYAGQGMQDMGYHPKTLGAVSDVDTRFAQALSLMPVWQQADVIQAMGRMSDIQQENFKSQYLAGNIPSYQMENLGL